MKCRALLAKKRTNAGYGMPLTMISRDVLAYTLGSREDKVFLELKRLLQPFGISRFYTDKWGAYARHLDGEYCLCLKCCYQKLTIAVSAR